MQKMNIGIFLDLGLMKRYQDPRSSLVCIIILTIDLHPKNRQEADRYAMGCFNLKIQLAFLLWCHPKPSVTISDDHDAPLPQDPLAFRWVKEAVQELPNHLLKNELLELVYHSGLQM
jgi:hypothetical protein